MIRLPKSIKISLFILLGLFLIVFFTWFFYQDVTNVRLARLSNKVETTSDVPSFTLKEGDTRKFNEILDKWQAFGKDKFYLYSTRGYVSPEKILFHLTDQQQPYEWVHLNDAKGKVVKSVGEKWDKNTKALDLYFFIDPEILKDAHPSALDKIYTELVLSTLYHRTHKDDKTPIAKIQPEVYAFSKANKFPFSLERK